ncbi:MAG: methylmalonyl-CoA epimerase [Candidatus Promineifilaceae bacterium]
MVTNINHIAIVVPELEEGATFWADALGLTVSKIEEVPEQAVRIAFLPVGDSSIELLEPTTEDSGIARFLENRGPGLHHLCLEVEDLDAVLERLRQYGIPLIDETPLTSRDGIRLAFIHPKGTGGTLVELYELSRSDTTTRP